MTPGDGSVPVPCTGKTSERRIQWKGKPGRVGWKTQSPSLTRSRRIETYREVSFVSRLPNPPRPPPLVVLSLFRREESLGCRVRGVSTDPEPGPLLRESLCKTKTGPYRPQSDSGDPEGEGKGHSE